jgi:hypothetical protein
MLNRFLHQLYTAAALPWWRLKDTHVRQHCAGGVLRRGDGLLSEVRLEGERLRDRSRKTANTGPVLGQQAELRVKLLNGRHNVVPNEIM